MKMIALDPHLINELPANCPSCPLVWCTIPMKANGVDYRIDCTNKRSKRCPLIEVDARYDA